MEHIIMETTEIELQPNNMNMEEALLRTAPHYSMSNTLPCPAQGATSSDFLIGEGWSLCPVF
jgi:hypothetical protein